MAKYEIQITRERCTGCLRCALACSDLYSRRFNPAVSRIEVVSSDADCSIHLTEECNGCGVCVDHCFYEALYKSRREGEE
jgi:Fe-S-cluster-containing hydrogenase component 2